jgi:cholesterol transport system auxiliary component
MSPTMNAHRHLLSTRSPAILPILLTVLAALLLTGCGNMLPARERQPVQQYLLDWQPPGQAAQAAADAPVLQLSPVHAAAGFGGSDLLYVRQAHRLQRFARHRWADSPARMLDPLLVKAAEASGLFSAVAAPGAAIRADLHLDTQLLQLQQRIQDGDSRVELTLRATLIRVADGRQVAARTFRIEEAAPATPYGGVQAANRAVGRLLPELTAFLAHQLKSE